MVFCGRPSRACLPCRSKRRRCDFATPSCNQCLRARITCHGYRDTSLISFRDETLTVSCKAQRKTDKSRGSPDSLDLLKSRPRTHLKDADWSSPLLHLYPDIDTIATKYFLETYVGDTTYCYLPVYWDRFRNDDIVNVAVLPIATASFAQTLKQPQLMQQARIQYSIALVATNNALSRPESATKDNVLLSVLLLAMYEALTYRGRVSPRSYNMHINGLISILKLREAPRTMDRLGESLTRHACNQIMSYCLQCRLPIPPHVESLQGWTSEKLTTYDTPDSGILLYRISTLRTNMSGMLATDVVKECLDLDQLTQQLMSSFHASQPYTVLSNKGGAGVIKCDREKVHHYSSQNAARRWNSLRIVRVALHEWIHCAFNDLRGIIYDTPPPGDALYDEWYKLPRTAPEIVEAAINEILDSVPYVRGCLGTSSNNGARYLSWPLAASASSELCPEPLKKCIIAQLKDICARDHIEQAMEAAVMLEEGTDMEDWLNVSQYS